MLVKLVRVFQIRFQGTDDQSFESEFFFYTDAVDLCSWTPFIVGCVGKQSDTWVTKKPLHPLPTLKPAAQVLSFQLDSPPRYLNPVLGNHQSSVANASFQYFNLTFSLLQRQTGRANDIILQRRRPSIAKVIRQPLYHTGDDDLCPFVGHSDVGTASTPSTSKSPPIGAIVGGVVGGVIVLLVAIFIAIYIMRRTSQRNASQLNASQLNGNGGPSSMMKSNHTHLRSESDVTTNSNNNMSMPTGYTSLLSTSMRPPTSPTIRTHGTSSIRSFPFFSTAGSTLASLSPVRQQSPPPASVHRDEAAVEPFVLAPNHNPDRKQANGAYPTYDQPNAPSSTVLRMDVRSTTPTGGRGKFNPPAYTEQTKASPRSRPPQAMGGAHAKKGSADTQHSITSSRSGASGGAIRAGGNIANVVNPSVPVRAAIITQLNPPAAAASGSTTANPNPTLHERQLSGFTSNAPVDKRRPTDTEDSFSIAWFTPGKSKFSETVPNS